MTAPYADMFYRVLMSSTPPGAYSDDDDSWHAIIKRALSIGLSSALELVYQLATEMFPQTAVECLPDWEAAYQIAVPSGASTADRQAELLAQVRGGKSTSLASFTEQMNPLLGVGAYLVRENLAADVTTNPEQVFFTFVWRDPYSIGSYNIKAAQMLADRVKEAHELIVVGESYNFRCDDPYSLTDRDTLGA